MEAPWKLDEKKTRPRATVRRWNRIGVGEERFLVRLNFGNNGRIKVQGSVQTDVPRRSFQTFSFPIILRCLGEVALLSFFGFCISVEDGRRVCSVGIRIRWTKAFWRVVCHCGTKLGYKYRRQKVGKCVCLLWIDFPNLIFWILWTYKGRVLVEVFRFVIWREHCIKQYQQKYQFEFPDALGLYVLDKRNIINSIF